MAGMSLLLRPGLLRLGLFRLLTNNQVVITPLKKQGQLLAQVSVRNSGHERKMVVVPSNFSYNRFKDDMHFYLFLGFAPMLALITYVNIFIGPAELSETPEGYEPKEYEYHQNPIKRWFAKYVYEEPQKDYERSLHFLHQRREDRYWKKLENKVRSLQQDRLDYKGWYWAEADKSIVDDEKAGKEYKAKIQGGGR